MELPALHSDPNSAGEFVSDVAKGVNPFYCTREYWQGVSQNVVGGVISAVLAVAFVLVIERVIVGHRVPVIRGEIPAP